MSTTELLILSGLPGSGKSTCAFEWINEDPNNRKRINWDDLRTEMYGSSWIYSKADENRMKEFSEASAIEALRAGKSVVIDNTNLTPRVREKWASLGRANGATVIEQEIDTPVAVCKMRDEQRTGRSRVGWAAIDRMALFNGFIDWEDRELYPRDFIICDLDGTIADCESRKPWMKPHIMHKLDCSMGALRGIPDWDDVFTYCEQCGVKAKKNYDKFYEGVENDPPILPILELLERFGNTYDFLVVSGRPVDKAGKGTEEWLRKHLIKDRYIYPKHLFLRASGDRRPDTEVKQELLDLLPKHRIKYVLEDRERIVEMYRKNGLTCLQTAAGSY